MIRLAGATVQGLCHERLGLPCQDAHYCRILDSEIVLLAVADGAGSASHSQIGSATAIQTIESLFCSQTLPAFEDADAWKGLFWQAMQWVRNALEGQATQLGIEAREFATTLLLALSFPCGILVSQVGDGAVVLRDKQGDLHTLATPRTGEYYNETQFVTSIESIDEVGFHTFTGQITHIALFTDGLESVALQMPDAIAHPPFFTPLFQFVAHVESPMEAQNQLEQFLRSPRLRERADDDLTLVLMARGN